MRPSAPPTTQTRQHLLGLDGLRGLATLLVVLYHHALTTGYGNDGGALRFLKPLTHSGWVGVDIFFALSGFLVTGILLRKQDEPGYLRTFYTRRALRILPLYGLLLLFLLYLVPAVLPSDHPLATSLDRARGHQLWLWTLTVNQWMAATGERIGGALEPCWSLCVEVHYYLVWPFVVRFARARHLPTLCMGLWLLAWCLRASLWNADVSAQAMYFATPTRLDSVFAGTLVAAWLWTDEGRAQLTAWAGWAFGVAGAGLLALVVVQRGLQEQAVATPLVAYSLLAIASGASVALAQEPGSWTQRGLSIAPLRALGRYSYAIYLFNLPIFTYLHLTVPMDMPWRAAAIFAFGAAATYGLSLLSYRYIEQPLLRPRPTPRA